MGVKAHPEYGREVVFLLGVAGSGKTKRCIDALRGFEAEGRPALYLVPEQSTYLADRQILEPPGPEAVRHVRVVSFQRLGFLLEEPGASSRSRTLDRSGRRILLRSLFSRLDPSLQLPFLAVADRPGFLESVVSVLREIRDHAGSGGSAIIDDLAERADVPGDLRGKLATVAALRRAYAEALAARGLRDPDSLLIETPAMILAHGSEFRGRPVLVDGFLSFTRLETEILAALAQAGARLTIALCMDPDLAPLEREVAPPPPRCRIMEWPSGFAARAGRPVFLAPLRTFAEVRARIHAAGFHTSVESLARPAPRFRSQEIARLERDVLGRVRASVGGSGKGRGEGRREAPHGDSALDVQLLAARDPAHEVEIWARRIDRWIRLDEEPIRPGDVAIVVRDLETYRPLVEDTFARYRVPVFVDRHWDLSSRPLVRTILDALEVLRTGWQRDAVISFLRSPRLGCKSGEIDLVENLSMEAGYDYGQWKGPPWEPLRLPPRTRYVRGEGDGERAGDAEEGDASGEETAVEDTEASVPRDPSVDSAENAVERARTAIANRIRERHLRPLEVLEGKLSSGRVGGKEAVAALRAWMTEAGISGAVAGSDQERELEAVVRVCDQVAGESMGGDLTIDSFAGLLTAGLQSLKIGRTPTRPDAVVLAEVQRSRMGEVRRAIVGGLSARDFPRAVASDRFFTESERAQLAALGLDLGTPDPLRQEEEAYFLYIAVTRASESLLLTRPTTDVEGSSLDPSPFLDEIRSALPGLAEIAPEVEEKPAELGDTQTIEELAARVGAYIASRLDRRLAGRGAQPEEADAMPADRRILTVYNRLVVPPQGWSEVDARSILAESGRSWGYRNRAWLPEEVARLAVGERTHTASVGRLESFARCPYQHFARHMLRLERRAEAKVTPLENGLLTHRALEILMRQGPPETEREAIARRLSGVFDQIQNEPDLKAFSVASGGAFRWQSTRRRLRRFLEIEALRLTDSDFQPAQFEREFGTAETKALRIPLPDGRALLLRGRIDRIDIADLEGRQAALVIDYKSGSIVDRGRPADLLRGTDLQLAVYLLVASEVLGLEPFGALYAPVLPKPRSDPSKDPENPLDIKFVGLLPMERWDRVARKHALLKKSRPPLATGDELLELLRGASETLALYAGALMRGRIAVAPAKIGSKSPCDACEFKALCRVDEAYNPFRASPKDGLAGEDPS